MNSLSSTQDNPVVRQPVTAGGTQQLLPQHAELIGDSGIKVEVAKARGYRTVTTRAALQGLGFSEAQRRVPALLIPIWGISGDIATYQIRPDQPRIVNGKALKYETPRGARMVLDVPPGLRPSLANPKIPLFITEGARKADAAVSHGLCCISLLGVWNWRGTNEWGGKTALSDWESIALKHRQVCIAFDSDVMLKKAVHAALARLKPFLEQRGAKVAVIYLPPGENGQKVGLDDFFAAEHTTQELLALARPDLAPIEDEASSPTLYQETPTGLVWLRMTRDGEVATPLTNFTARIVGDIARDDGVEVHRVFEVEAQLRGRVERAPLPASQLFTMNWPVEILGAGAVVSAGFGLKDHARAAVQHLSGDVPQRRVYTHTGWCTIDGQYVYLHGGGPIGPMGPIAGIEVDLAGVLGRVILPASPVGEALQASVKKSLGVLDLAPWQTTVPLYAAIPRAVFGRADFNIHLAGPTGVGKTEMAALVQQHFGAGMDARNLPGSWSSTGNALEELAFQAKDVLLVVDDFIPTGSMADVQRAHRDADRVLRAQGNRSGRQRMRSDGTLRAPRPPRGLIVSTGEEVPRGQSLRARVLVLEMEASDLHWSRLTGCQGEAASGVFAEATAGFIQWVAPHYEQVLARFRDEVARLRENAVAKHRRTPAIIADLGAALRLWLVYAQEVGTIGSEEADAIWRRAWLALLEAGQAQSDHQQAEEPVTQFWNWISAAVASGRAHVATPDGNPPRSPEGWGWRMVIIGREGETDWRPSGNRIGWLDGEHLYLEPHASYAVGQEMGRHAGATLPNPKTLHKRLHEQGMLASTDRGRRKLTVRRTLEGRRQNVLHFLADRLGSCESAQSAQEEQTLYDTAEDSGPIPSEDREDRPAESAHATVKIAPNPGALDAVTRLPW